MTRHNVDYKKIRTDIINGKKRCVYMKPKGKREYVKSGGEFVSLSAYIKTLQKKNKKKGGAGYIDRETIPAKVRKMLTNLKAKSTSLARGLMGKGHDEFVSDATKFSSRVSHDNPRLYISNYDFHNQQLLENSNLKDAEHRQEVREKAHKLGSKIRSKIRNTFLGNNGNSEGHASNGFGVAEVLRYDAAGRLVHVVRPPEVRADLVYLDTRQGRPTAPPTYPPEPPGYA
jgi:hypothetical protein